MERNRRRTEALLREFALWMAERKRRPLRQETRRLYLVCVRHAIEIANGGGHLLLSGDVRTVRYVLGRLSPHPGTQNAYISALIALYSFLEEQGIRKDNPAQQIIRPRHLKSFPRPLSLEACCAYLDAAHLISARHYMLATLGLFMGLRRTEIRTQRWPNFFKSEEGRWCDLTGKGGKEARLPVPSVVGFALDQLRESHQDPVWLFPSPHRARIGQPVSQSWMTTAHAKILEKAGLDPKLHLHQLRHSFGTYLRKAGADLAEVQDALRHSDPATSRIYMDVFKEDLAVLMGKLAFGRHGAAPLGEVAASLPPSWQERRQGS